MLEHPPTILLPAIDAVANVTSWFDWNALEAVGTVGALWFAVVQASRAGRADRLRSVGVLTTLVGLLEPITELVPQFDDRESDQLDPDEVDYLLSAPPAVDRAIQGLGALGLSDVAAVGAAEWVTALHLVLGGIRDALPITKDDVISASAFRDMDYVCEAVDRFRGQRDELNHGPIGSFLRQTTRSIAARYSHYRFRQRRRRAAPLVPAPVKVADKSRRGAGDGG